MFRKTNVRWEIVSLNEQVIEPEQNTKMHYNQYIGILEAPKITKRVFKKEWLIKRVLMIANIKGVEVPTYSGADYKLVNTNGKYEVLLNNDVFASFINGDWNILSNYDKKEVLSDIMPIISNLISNEA